MNWLTAIFNLPKTLEKIMTTLVQLTDTLVAIQSQLVKAQAEIVSKIDELSDALVNVSLPPEAEVALANLKLQAVALDNIVPDAIPDEDEVVE